MSADKPRLRLRVVPTTLAIVFSVLALVAWYIVTARAVTLIVEPEPEDIDLDGGLFAVELGGRYLLRPGEYRISADKEGYYPFEATFEVSTESRQEYAFALRKLPGLLSIQTQPVAGATILIDDIEVGMTPVTDLEVEPGEHLVTIRADRYLDYQTRIDIEGMRVSQAIGTELLPAWADIGISSEPDGATLLVDGTETGVTPVVAEIVRGARELELVLPGYKVWQMEIDVIEGEPQNLPTIRLEKADGVISVVTSPSGAAVTVNGRYRGRSPVQLALNPGQTYRIGASKAGYKPVTRAVSVRSEQREILRLDLSANLGVVRIESWPADASIYVNGARRGQGTQVLTLPAMPQAIEIRKDGYATFRTTVTPRPGFDQRVTATLKTVAQARLDALQETVRNALGQELRLVRPGRFTMGASRREQGRQANEMLREVELTRYFYVSTRPVSNQEFRRFDASHSSGDVLGENLNGPNQPVVNVTWNQAARFCNWLSARESLAGAYVEEGGKMVPVQPPTPGYRLPTEAEWAWAARFAGGARSTRFPWGDNLPPADKSGNYADNAAQRIVPTILPDYDDGFAASSPIGRFKPNELGLYDVGGNVAEWTNDYYSGGMVAVGSVATDPLGPATGDDHVIRGSSWRQATRTSLRLSYRDYGKDGRPDLGFRVARYAD